VHNTLLKVPMVALFPGGAHAGEVRGDRAELLDLFPTILARCGVTPPRGGPGRDLFAKDAESVDTAVFAEYYYPRQVLSVFKPVLLALDMTERNRRAARLVPFMRRLRAVQDDEFKLVWGSDGAHELYRIDRDPGETRNLAADPANRKVVDDLVSRLEDMVERNEGRNEIGPPPPVGWMMPGFEEKVDDPELLKKLRSLGYIK
jgi:arylsulfatase A-like enzyme